MTSTPELSTSSAAASNQPVEPWKLVSVKRKGSPIQNKVTGKQTKLTSYWLGPTPTHNQFNELADNIEPETLAEPKPPPIFVNEVDNIIPLQALLRCVAPDAHSIKIINSNHVKITSDSKEVYSAIVKALTEKSTKFHTYQLKENRAFRVVLKHVHHTSDVDEIKESLKLRGHVVRNIHNILQRGTKNPLPMFFVDLEPSSNNKEVYGIDLLMNLKVTFEPPRQKREIVQCSNCQRYGHTKRFCFNNARCVKCIGNHPTSSCNRAKPDSQVQCILCKGNHSANYKGCEIYKNLQSKNFPKLRERHQPMNSNVIQPKQPISAKVQPNISYAQIVNNQQNERDPDQAGPSSSHPAVTNPGQNCQNNDMLELKQMMKALLEQMGTMMNLLTIVVSKMK